MDQVDFSTLYRRYAPDVLRFATYLTGDRLEAEEITQETFVRAWMGQGGIRGETIKAYLFTIARHLHLDRWRDHRRHADLAEDHIDPTPGPAEQLDDRSELGRVLRVVQTLPEQDRAALLMRAFDELSYEEIGAALGLTAVAARVRVHRARVKLAEHRLHEEES